MNVGEKINILRKKNNLSQDAFANLLHVTRQTVSNWEKEKSYPDLETLLKISDEFQISLDELLKDDVATVKNIDAEKKKKHSLLILICILVFTFFIFGLWMYQKYKTSNAISFDMEQSKTYQQQETKQSVLDVGTGYFLLPKNGKINIRLNAQIDSGKLHIKITDSKETICYQLDGQTLKDSQTLYFNKGSYKIQIIADNYTEDVVSLSYSIKIKN